MPIAFPATLWSSSSGGSTAPAPLVYWEADYGIVTTTNGTTADSSPVSGNKVLSWTSKDGSATVASYGTNSQRPTYYVPIYGSPYVTFNAAANEQLQTTAWNATFNNAQAYTIGCAFRKPPAYTAYHNENFLSLNNSGNAGMLLTQGSVPMSVGMWSGSPSYMGTRVLLNSTFTPTGFSTVFGSFSTTATNTTTAASSNTRIYSDGVLSASDTTSLATVNYTDAITLGGPVVTAGSNKDFYGFYLYNTQLSDAQVLSVHNAIVARNGVTDKYAINNSLLLHMDGANGSTTFTDSSPNALAVTANGATISTANTMSGFGQVCHLNGTSSALQVTSSLVDFSGADCTFEFWFYASDVASTSILMESGTGATGDTQCYIYNNSIFWGTSGTGGQVSLSVTASSWHFFCGVKSGTSYYFYLDGAKSSIVTRTPNSKTLLNIGARSGGTLRLAGDMDEIRFSRGIARQSGSSMTVPTGPFPNS